MGVIIKDIKEVSIDLVLQRYKGLYQAEYKPRHRQAISAFGVERYCELAEFAIKRGEHAGRLMSSLITSEYKRADNRARVLAIARQPDIKSF